MVMKTKIVKMNKPVYLGLLNLSKSKIAIYQYWYNYAKPKYRDNAKLCYMDTDSFIVHIKSEDVYENLTRDVETRSGTSNNIKIHLPIGKNKKLIRLMKDEMGGKIMKEVATLRSQMHSCLTDEDLLARKEKAQRNV